MEKINKLTNYFSRGELMLWFGSAFIIVVAFCLFDRNNYLTLLASLIGVTSLIFNAKGNPLGQLLIIFFSLIYGGISYSFGYYGEMITYIGMTMPMAAFALISWMKNPYNGNAAEVEIRRLPRGEWGSIFLIAIFVTIGFYFILEHFKTANIIPSTLSVTTSFIAAFLTFKRSPYFAIGYAVNDIVLIVMWSLAMVENIEYISVVVCFAAFLVNDIYGFINWKRIEKRQAEIIC